MKKYFLCLSLLAFLMSCQRQTKEDKKPRLPVSVKTHQIKDSEEFSVGGSLGPVFPIEHGSFALQLNHQMIYVDPMGNSTLYTELPKADLVLITHYHPDYLVPSAMEALVSENTTLLVPESVKTVLPGDLEKKAKVLEESEDFDFHEIQIKVLKNKHFSKDSTTRGNSYVINNERTSVLVIDDFDELNYDDLPQIDIALVKMNMTDFSELTKVVDAILKIKPNKVYPYYYEGSFSYSKVAILTKRIKEKNPNIEVEVLNWYPINEELIF